MFYHAQDAMDLHETGGMYLGWAGDAREIIEVLSEDFEVEWDGLPEHRMRIRLRRH